MAPTSLARRSNSAPTRIPPRPPGVQPWQSAPRPVSRAQSLPQPTPRPPLPVAAPAPSLRQSSAVRYPRADPLTDSRYTDYIFFLLTGVRKYIFRYFYVKYCGRGTLIDKHIKLFMLLRWYKWYPRSRELGVALGVRQHGTRLVYDIQRWSAWLAARMRNAEVLHAWDARLQPLNSLPVPAALFTGRVIGSVDTFPIYLSKPKHKGWQTATYSGKYAGNVLKVQMIVDNSGTPIWLSGPHMGSYADIRLARRHMPAGMAEDERILGDRAYCADDMPHLVAPYKKPPQQRQRAGQPAPPDAEKLTRQQGAFNRVSTPVVRPPHVAPIAHTLWLTRHVTALC